MSATRREHVWKSTRRHNCVQHHTSTAKVSGEKASESLLINRNQSLRSIKRAIHRHFHDTMIRDNIANRWVITYTACERRNACIHAVSAVLASGKGGADREFSATLIETGGKRVASGKDFDGTGKLTVREDSVALLNATTATALAQALRTQGEYSLSPFNSAPESCLLHKLY